MIKKRGRPRNAFQVIPSVERHHSLIEQLRTRAPRLIPGSQLALGLGVSVRTVERDVAQLRDAGVPISVLKGPGGGYSIDARSKLSPTTFTPGEASALVASLVAVGPYVSAAAQSALRKLLDSLSAE